MFIYLFFAYIQISYETKSNNEHLFSNEYNDEINYDILDSMMLNDATKAQGAILIEELCNTISNEFKFLIYKLSFKFLADLENQISTFTTKEKCKIYKTILKWISKNILNLFHNFNLKNKKELKKEILTSFDDFIKKKTYFKNVFFDKDLHKHIMNLIKSTNEKYNNYNEQKSFIDKTDKINKSILAENGAYIYKEHFKPYYSNGISKAILNLKNKIRFLLYNEKTFYNKFNVLLIEKLLLNLNKLEFFNEEKYFDKNDKLFIESTSKFKEFIDRKFDETKTRMYQLYFF